MVRKLEVCVKVVALLIAGWLATAAIVDDSRLAINGALADDAAREAR